MSSQVLQRARITNCPHGGKHNGVDGYIVDTYSDGSVAIDMGFNHTCITPGWEDLPPVKREDIHFDDESDGQESDTEMPKRRGRPSKPKVISISTEAGPKRRGRPPRPYSPVGGPSEETQAKQTEVQGQKSVSTPERDFAAHQPLLTVSSRHGDRLTLAYRDGETTVEAVNICKDDLVALCAIVESLTTQGRQ